MTKVTPLFSSSSGNVIHISSGNKSILVDAGVSCKRIVTATTSISQDARDIDAIFITHEHSDHIKGLYIFTKNYKVPVYGSAAVLRYLAAKDLVYSGTPLIPIDSNVQSVGDFCVSAFPTSHDSVGSVGFRIEAADGRVVSVATDLGKVTPEVEQGLHGCTLAVIESNYDEKMLRTGCYPYHLKQRISSNIGHLSNSDCAGLLASLVKGGTENFILAHLSKENNLPSLAEQSAKGTEVGTDFRLLVAPPVGIGQSLRV